MIPSNDDTIYIPVYDLIPEEWEDARAFLTERLREITNGVNARDFGEYLDRETLTGQSWTPNAGTELRSGFRKVITIGALNDFTATNPQPVPHGITFSDNSCVTNLYGAATNQATFAGIPLPYVDSAGAAHIQISIDGTNIILTSTIDYSAYTCAYIVVEYLDEA